MTLARQSDYELHLTMAPEVLHAKTLMGTFGVLELTVGNKDHPLDSKKSFMKLANISTLSTGIAL